MAIEVVSLLERPMLAVDLYDVIAHNRDNMSVFVASQSEHYPDPAGFRASVEASVQAEPDPVSGEFVDFRAILLGNTVIGGLNVITRENNVGQFRTVNFFIDIARGYDRRGYATEAVGQVTSQLLADAEIDFVDAYTLPHHRASQGVLSRTGFKRYHPGWGEPNDRIRFTKPNEYPEADS